MYLLFSNTKACNQFQGSSDCLTNTCFLAPLLVLTKMLVSSQLPYKTVHISVLINHICTSN